jgi:hypothetical protein
MLAFENTGLWKRSLADIGANDPYRHEREKLRVALLKVRDKTIVLSQRIAASLPGLTVHDVTHLDALWETADLIAGPDYPFNPMEAFVFGCSVLFHDSAQCFEAYEGGLAEVRKSVAWQDAFALERERSPHAKLSEIEATADFVAIRILHARQAKELASKMWRDPVNGTELYLIEDVELRTRFGPIAGAVAERHNRSIEEVGSNLRSQINAPGTYPAEWRVDEIKIACLLRCADAAHLDDRRAPDFVHALLRRSGVSFDHWKSQNWLGRIDIDLSDNSGKSAIITSTRPFKAEDSAAWWIAYDAIELLDREVKSSNALLRSRPQSSMSPPFKIEQVKGAGSPEQLVRHVEVKGWRPSPAKIHIGNVERLVATLGGASLYGEGTNQLQVVLRELLQNARDAVAARRVLHNDYIGKIIVRLRDASNNQTILEVGDDGIGMSERVLTGPLLDFGTSFWANELVASEFPGLKASTFRPVGKFGIGFYSIFMVAKKATVTSRRCDHGLEDVAQLQFPDGLTMRPTFTRNRPEGFGTYTSTLVQCWLDKGIDNYRTFTINPGLVDIKEYQVPLRDLIAVLTAGLDVRVEVQICDEPIQVAHLPIIEVARNASDTLIWLKDICPALGRSHTEGISYIEKHANRVRRIEVDGLLVGYAALSTRPPNLPGVGGVSTIGGLATAFQGRDTSYIGYFDNVAKSAKRDNAARVASDADLAKWGLEQVDLLKSENLADVEWHYVANYLCNFGIDPISVLNYPISINGQIFLLSQEQLYDVLRGSPIAVIKMGTHDIIDAYSQYAQFENYPTLKPICAGSLLSTALDNQTAKEQRSFVGCIERLVLSRGSKIKFEVRKGVMRSQFGSLDALLVSLD